MPWAVLCRRKAAYAKWLKSHQPFHWFVQFYGILIAGGFDVIIGNPPYVAAAKVRKSYAVKNLATANCTDIYAPFQPALWKHRIPKLNTAALASAFESLLGPAAHTLDFITSPRATKHVLHFKKSAYNWLNFCRAMPPCYEDNQRVEHTKFGEIYFPDVATCELALLLSNGKLMMIYWFAIADDFDVTRWNFADFPTDFSVLSEKQRATLLARVPELERAMKAAIQFKLNAGRRVGNYNLAKCRDVTDQSDLIFAEALGFADVWEDIELYYAQTMKTDFSDVEEE